MACVQAHTMCQRWSASTPLHLFDRMRVCTHQSKVLWRSEPAVGRRQQSDNKVNNNTKRSLCPWKDALSTRTKVRKDTHASVKPLSLCFAFNGVLGLINTMNSAIRYSRKSERWKSKSTKSVKLWAREKCYSNDYQNHEYSHTHIHEYIRDRSSTAQPLVNHW